LLADRLTRYAPHVLGVLRIMTALLFIAHGTQKLFNFPAAAQPMPVEGIFLVAGILEVVGGLAILLGLFTRPVAFVLSGMMAVAYFMAHHPMNFFPTNNAGDAAILFCFVFLYLVFAGPGRFSIDGAQGRA
jgi:putative oxidoreductase